MAKLNIVRSFYPTPLPEALVNEIISAGYNSMLSCVRSGCGRFPLLDYFAYQWVTGSQKGELISVLRRGYARERVRPLLPILSTEKIKASVGLTELEAAEEQLSLLEQAPVLISLLNAEGHDPSLLATAELRVIEQRGIQCVALAAGAMCFRAADLGLGCLLSTYTYLAQEELRQMYAGTEPVALLALGYADEVDTTVQMYEIPPAGSAK